MAIYHLSAKVMSRGRGQSAVAAAAYRSGDPLMDERTGELKSYERRALRIIHTEILAPAHAPDWARDRNALWNAAERAENRKDSQLAREIEVSLPHELTEQQRLYLVKDFAREAFVRRGYVVDLSIHTPDRGGDLRNHHAHLMITMRVLGPDGFAPMKDRSLNSTEQLEVWRAQWANLANRHLKRHGHDARIDHRSLEAQGIAREPTTHVGYAAQEIAARGAQSDRMDTHNAILERNNIRAELQAGEEELAQLRELVANENRKPRMPGSSREPRPMLDGPTDDELKKQPGREKEYLKHLEERHARAQAVLEEQRRAFDLDQRAISFQQAKEIEAEDGRRKKAEQEAAPAHGDRNGDISSASARYSIALGNTYDVRDPYASLARAAGAESAMFHRNQEQLRADAARETDPDKRQAIDLRRKIEGCEYMAITSDRLAGISTVVTGNANNEYAVKDRQQAAHYRAMAEGLREERGVVLETVQARSEAMKDLAAKKPSVEPRARADAAPPYRQILSPAQPDPAARPEAAREPLPGTAPAPQTKADISLDAVNGRQSRGRTNTAAPTPVQTRQVLGAGREPAAANASVRDPAATLRPSEQLKAASFEAVPSRTQFVTMPKEAATAQPAQVSAEAPFGPKPRNSQAQAGSAIAAPEARKEAGAEPAPHRPGYRKEMLAAVQELRVMEKDGKEAGTLSAFLQREQPRAAEPYRPPSMGTLLSDNNAWKRHQMEQLREMETAHKADKALDRIGGDMTKGRTVQAEDLRSLTREQWDSAKTKGEDGLRQSVREAKDRGDDGHSRGGGGPPNRKDP